MNYFCILLVVVCFQKACCQSEPEILELPVNRSMCVDRNLAGEMDPALVTLNQKPAGLDALIFEGKSQGECEIKCRKMADCLYITWHATKSACQLFNHKATILPVDDWKYTTSVSFEVIALSDDESNEKSILTTKPPFGFGNLFLVNRQEVGGPRAYGLNIAVIDRLTRQVIHWQSFSTNDDQDAMVRLGKILPDDIVLLAATYDGFRCGTSCVEFLSQFGAKRAHLIAFGRNYALIGYKGPCEPTWISEDSRASFVGYPRRPQVIIRRTYIPTKC